MNYIRSRSRNKQIIATVLFSCISSINNKRSMLRFQSTTSPLRGWSACGSWRSDSRARPKNCREKKRSPPPELLKQAGQGANSSLIKHLSSFTLPLQSQLAKPDPLMLTDERQPYVNAPTPRGPRQKITKHVHDKNSVRFAFSLL